MPLSYAHNPDPYPRGFRTEAELLLCCARTRLDAARAEAIPRLARTPPDWKALFRLAQFHRLLPLLHRHLTRLCPEAVPPLVLARMRQSCRLEAQQAFLLASELVRLLEILEEGGVRALPYKGPVLAGALYGDPALRPCDDLDLFLPAGDIPAAKALLISRGYRPLYTLSPRREARLLRTGYHYNLLRDSPQVLVELHWRLADAYFAPPLRFEDCELRQAPAALAGRTVKTLGGEELLLALCVHGAKHCWGSLGMITDVAQLLSEPSRLDWQRLRATSAALGCRRRLLLALFLASRLLGASLPSGEAQEVSSDRAVLSLVGEVTRSLLLPEPRPPGLFQMLRFHLGCQERMRDRLRYIAGAWTPTVSDWRDSPLPESLQLLEFLRRPLRLLTKYGWRSGAAPGRLKVPPGN